MGQPVGMAAMTPQCAAMKAGTQTTGFKWESTACIGTKPTFVCESGR